MAESRFLAIFVIFSMILSSAIVLIPSEGTSSSQQTFGTTTYTSQWVISAGTPVEFTNETIYAQQGIQVNTNAYLNLTNSTVECTQDFIINGNVKFINVTLYMNCSTNGQYRLDVTGTGNFTAMDSTITALDTTTPHLYPTAPVFDSWGQHYYFYARSGSRMYLKSSTITQMYGDPTNRIAGGGIRIYSEDVLIDGCDIGQSEIAGVFVTGNIQPEIKNSVIYNNTWSQFLCAYDAHPIFDNNVITDGRLEGGWGAFFYEDCHVKFTNNIVEFNNWAGLGLQKHCNATISGNTFRNNSFYGGIYVWGYIEDIGPYIDNNHIYNNTHGIRLQPYDDQLTQAGFIAGNISNNLIENNNITGILVDNYGATRGLGSTINTTLYNNTVVSNNAGVVVWESVPDVVYNNISSNDLTGLYIIENSDANVMHNTVSDNGDVGIFINRSSAPYIFDNTVQHNDIVGIFSHNAEPAIISNNVSMNNNSGIFVDRQSKTFNIEGNDITLNELDGIVLNRSSPNIKNSNIIESNKQNGISVFNSSNPVISGNKIRNNEANGLLFYGTGGTLNGNNNISWNRQNGVACYAGANPAIGFSSIYQNYDSGVFSYNSRPRVVNCQVTGNLKNGINSTQLSGDRLENSTISASGIFDYYLTSNTHPKAINSVYDKASVYFGDTVSTLEGQWFFNVNVTDKFSNPIGNAVLNITETAADGKVVWTGIADGAGKARYINVTKYIQTQSGTTPKGPHYVNADMFTYVAASKGPFSGERNFWVDFALAANVAPVPEIFHGPNSTHSTRPTLTWGKGTDIDSPKIYYNLKLGTTKNTTNVLWRTDLATNKYTLPTNTISHSNSVVEQVFHVTIEYEDKDGGKAWTYGTFKLVNTRPTRPYINLTPSEVTILDSITCTIDATSQDVDVNPTDSIAYTYQWYVNDIMRPTLSKNLTQELSMTIKSGDGGVVWKKNDRISCSVFAYDGYLNGLADSKEIKLKNIPPTINKTMTDLVMTEDTPLANVLNLFEYFNDPDDYFGDASTTTLDLRYKSSLNISVVINSDGSIDLTPAEDWHGEETITFIAEDSSGAAVQTELKVTVKSVNDLPKIVKLGPADSMKIVIADTIMPFSLEENGKWFYIDVEVEDRDIAHGDDDELFFDIKTEKDITVEKYSDNPLRARISFLPTDDDIGTFTFTVRVRDSEDSTFDSEVVIKYTVSNVNDRPYINRITQKDTGFDQSFPPNTPDKKIGFLNERAAVEGKWFNFTIYYTDEDRGELFTFELDDRVRFTILESPRDSDSVEIQFLPTKSDVGSISVNFTIFDRAFAFDTVQVIIQVKNINDPPQALILNPQTMESFIFGSEIYFQGEYIDPDSSFGDKATFEWSSDKDGVFGDSKEERVSTLSIGWHDITFKVTDSGSLSSSVTIKVRIIDEDDTDADGLPDDWELLHFGDLDSNGPDNDPDGDGYTNKQEYEAGTDPNNAKSNPGEKAKGEVDDSIITYGIILAIICLIVAFLIFGYIMKTQRKKEVVGWDWMSQQDMDVGTPSTLPGYEQPQLPPPTASPETESRAPAPMPASEGTEELPAVIGKGPDYAKDSDATEVYGSDEPGGEETGGGDYECPECGAAIGETDTSCPSCRVEFE